MDDEVGFDEYHRLMLFKGPQQASFRRINEFFGSDSSGAGAGSLTVRSSATIDTIQRTNTIMDIPFELSRVVSLEEADLDVLDSGLNRVWAERNPSCLAAFHDLESRYTSSNPSIAVTPELLRFIIVALLAEFPHPQAKVHIEWICGVLGYTSEDFIGKCSEDDIVAELRQVRDSRYSAKHFTNGSKSLFASWDLARLKDSEDMVEVFFQHRSTLQRKVSENTALSPKNMFSKHRRSIVESSDTIPYAVSGLDVKFDALSAIQTLQLVLLGRNNSGQNIHRVDVVLSPRTTLWPLDKQSQVIILAFQKSFGVPSYYTPLCYLELLVKNVSGAVVWFEEVLEVTEELIPLSHSIQTWPIQHQEMVECLFRALFYWTKLIVSRYQVAFWNPDQSVDSKLGLSRCLELLRVCKTWLWKRTKDSDFKGQWSGFIAQLCSDAVLNRYEEIVGYAVESRNVSLASNVEVEEVGSSNTAKKDVFWDQLKKFADTSPNSMAKPKTLAVTLNLMDEDLIFCNIKSKGELVSVLELVRAELEVDLIHRTPVFDAIAPDFAFSKRTAEEFFALVWSDFQQLLRTQVSLLEGKGRFKFDASIFTVYWKLSEFYHFISDYVEDLPDLKLQSYFTPFIDLWLEERREHFTKKLVYQLLDEEEPLESNPMFTNSVFDLFRVLFEMSSVFKSSPFSSTHALSFAKLLSDIVSQFIENKHKSFLIKLGEDTSMEWGVEEGTIKLDPIVCRVLNDILICKDKLKEILLAVDLESVYRTTPILQQQPLAQRMETMIDDDVHDMIAEELWCVHAFHLIDRALAGTCGALTGKFSEFWVKSIVKFLWTKPYSTIFTLDEVEEALDPMWNHMLAYIRYMDESSIVTEQILTSIVDRISGITERALLASTTKTVLSKEQRNKILSILTLTKEMAICCKIKMSIDDMEVSKRLQVILEFLDKPSEELQRFDDFPRNEYFRLEVAPHVLEEHRDALLKYRSKVMKDPTAKPKRASLFKTLFKSNK